MATFYQRYVLPHLIKCACGSPQIAAKRREIAPRARGRVLELGVGGGLNLAFYDPARVQSVVGVDPSAELCAMAEKAPRQKGVSVTIEQGGAEALPFADQSFDCVVSAFTLCSVGSPAQSLAEAKRVLKPDGVFLFCEHGLSPDGAVARWQTRLDPVWKKLAGGCHLSRPVSSAIVAAGFRLIDSEADYLPQAPRIVGWIEQGEAKAF